MRVKEIEFGITVNLGNYESSKLSMKIELEEWEDYKQSLSKLKQEVIELAGADTSFIRKLVTNDDFEMIVSEILQRQEDFQDKERELEILKDQIEVYEDRIDQARDVLKILHSEENVVIRMLTSYDSLKKLSRSEQSEKQQDNDSGNEF